jgi:hypothetical protein
MEILGRAYSARGFDWVLPRPASAERGSTVWGGRAVWQVLRLGVCDTSLRMTVSLFDLDFVPVFVTERGK